VIEAIRDLGEYSLTKEKKQLDDPIDIIIEDPASTPAYKHILSIVINKSDDQFNFSEIRHEEYTKEKIGKYLYK
jgi:CRISPR-associated protein Csh1